MREIRGIMQEVDLDSAVCPNPELHRNEAGVEYVCPTCYTRALVQDLTAEQEGERP